MSSKDKNMFEKILNIDNDENKKCCTPKCAPKPKCPNPTFEDTNKFWVSSLFYNSKFWKTCLIINVFLIIFRLIYIKNLPYGNDEHKFFNKALFYFLLWLEIQYWSFIILILFSYKVYTILKQWIKNILFYWNGLISPRITNFIMKWLTLIQTDLFFWRVWCIFGIIFYSILSIMLFNFYIFVVLTMISILLGYTHF